MKQIFIFLFCLFFCFSASSKIYVNIGAPQKIKKSLIALSPFVLQDVNSNQNKLSKGKQMSERLEKNLKISGYFDILSPKAFIENPSTRSSIPYPKDTNGFRWQNWKLVGADFLFFADYSILQNQLVLNISFHNISLQKTLLRKKYNGKIGQENQIINKLSNDIVKILSGKKRNL